jgi:hypothetical protein
MSPSRAESRSPASVPREVRLWIDGVGTWLLWLPERLTIGGPPSLTSSRPPADLPLLADLARVHATIHRHPEYYLLALAGSGRVNGRPVAHEALLRGGEEITLGADVRLRFEVPSPLSASARVTFLSGHRPPERIDGLVLLAETCLLGAAPDHHIVCPEVQTPVVLYRKAGELWCRSPEEWRLEGRALTGAAPLAPGVLVASESVTFRIEMR